LRVSNSVLIHKMIKLDGTKIFRFYGLIKWVFGTIIVGIIAAVIFSFFLQPILNRLRGPDKYYIYLVGDFGESGDETVKQIRDVFTDMINIENMEIDGIDIETRYEDDNGLPSLAEKISKDLSERDDVLMVIGHFYSTSTQAALPNYLRDNSMIPVILTTETNPNLTEAYEGDEYKPIYALSPDDVNQAEIAANFATTGEQLQSFWVIKDVDNETYSNFLTLKFIERVQDKGGGKILMFTNNLSMPSLETIKAMEFDCVYFAGSWQNALILINQLKKIYKDDKKSPTVILSDWAVDQRLIDYGQDAVQGVFLTHQLSYRDFQEKRWGIFGEKAADLVRKIIKRVNEHEIKKSFIRNWLDMHRVRDAREAIREAMKAEFGERHRKPGNFHIWQIRGENSGDQTVSYKIEDVN
jgi:ABC-type branched-subunit amino acid transport system substrate-binding protein